MNRSFRQFALDAMSCRRRDLASSAYRSLAAVASLPYSLVVRTRNALFDRGLRASRHLGRPTISVGNLTTGGTGKTPVVTWLATALARRGHRVAVLLRGYGSRDPQQSDEARELRLRFRSASSGGNAIEVVANPDRVAAGRALLAREPAIDAFILDDGFQHRRAARDFDLILVDATNPFGFGRMLPRGLLREPISSLRRAHAVLLTRCDLVDEPELQRVTDMIHAVRADLVVHRSAQALGGLDNGDELRSLGDRPVGAFCGIGNPDAFKAMLLRAGLNLRAFEAFPDHHTFTPAELQGLRDRRRALGLECWLTTMKDAARLGDVATTLPARSVMLSLRFEEDAEKSLLQSIENALGSSRAEKRLHGGG